LKKHFSVLFRIISATAEALHAKRKRERERLNVNVCNNKFTASNFEVKGHGYHYETNINKILSDTEISIFLIA
jgi:hypothetical protein